METKYEKDGDIIGSHIKNPVLAECVRVGITLVVMMALVVLVYFFNTPNPNMILVAGVVVFTSLYGFISGAAATVIVLLYSLFFFSTDHSFFVFTKINLDKVLVSAIGATVCLVFVGLLKRRQSENNRKLRKTNDLLKAENEKLEKASLTDALTDARNRLAFRNDYDKFENYHIHMIMLDIDDFKQINDNYGHTVGDFVLKSFGRIITGIFGDEYSYRYGGDEFLIIVKDISEQEFNEKTEQLKKAINEIRLDENRIPVNFSAGCVYGKIILSSDLRHMLRQADDLLYEVKKEGKNGMYSAMFTRVSEEAEKNHHNPV
ncbi:MAG: sensor domain-containing diguanylate cyclase [Clostridia bacterium]|nr:sensor domain-containing diguanylate cyclase [Clostridia bacterium]